MPKGLVFELFWCEMGHRINPFWSESWEMGMDFTYFTWGGGGASKFCPFFDKILPRVSVIREMKAVEKFVK